MKTWFNTLLVAMTLGSVCGIGNAANTPDSHPLVHAATSPQTSPAAGTAGCAVTAEEQQLQTLERMTLGREHALEHARPALSGVWQRSIPRRQALAHRKLNAP